MVRSASVPTETIQIEMLFMVGWKRIWLACLLAIAGSGPLPLWLHQLVCHHAPGDHALACHSGHCGSGHCANESSNKSSWAAHGHSHAAAPGCSHHGHAIHLAGDRAGDVAA